MILMKKDLIVHSAQVVDEHILRPGDARIHEDILDEAADEHILLPGDARILGEGLGAGLGDFAHIVDDHILFQAVPESSM